MSPASPTALLSLLQLASSALPVGAYSYSEGLEFAIESGHITTAATLRDWLTRELLSGTIRIDGAVMLRVQRAVLMGDRAAITHWNAWLAALRDTAELRRQSEHMGHALADLLRSLNPDLTPWLDAATGRRSSVQFAVGFGIASASSGIDESSAVLGWLQSWATNAISAGIKLIPLGQTDGQRLLRALDGAIEQSAQFAQHAADTDLETSGWGASLASLQHEAQRVRLFRS